MESSLRFWKRQSRVEWWMGRGGWWVLLGGGRVQIRYSYTSSGRKKKKEGQVLSGVEGKAGIGKGHNFIFYTFTVNPAFLSSISRNTL